MPFSACKSSSHGLSHTENGMLGIQRNREICPAQIDARLYPKILVFPEKQKIYICAAHAIFFGHLVRSTTAAQNAPKNFGGTTL
jgi:hypothetical protein